ncbi:MAG: hypothetical protein AB7P34_23590 [Vicinamibacterales bacterium]
MSSTVAELYDALRRAGVGEELARDAARAVMGTEARNELATKADLSDLKADLIKWNVGAMAILTAIFAAIVRLG